MDFVKSVRPLDRYKLELTFQGGISGIIDLEGDLYGTMFEPLKDIEYFQQVKVDSERHTIYWPNGLDLAPEYLYEEAIKSKVMA